MEITVFYDGQCPICINEVNRWQSAPFNCTVHWFDITGQDEFLLRQGIDPGKALLELHLKTSDGKVLTSIDSYSLLLKQLPRWRWLGLLMALPGIKHSLKWIYDRMTLARLKKEGRWPITCDNGQCRKK